MKKDKDIVNLSRGAKAEINDLIWQCVNVMGSRCEGHNNDERINCSLCPKFKEGIERRREKRRLEKKFTINQVTTETGEEFLLMTNGNSYLLAIGERIEDKPNPDIFKINNSLELTFEDIGNLSTFFYFSGQKIVDMKSSSRNR